MKIGDTDSYTALAKVRKRCPWCSKPVEIGERATFTSFVRRYVGGACSLGMHAHSDKRITHAYHPDCRDKMLAFQAERARAS